MCPMFLCLQFIYAAVLRLNLTLSNWVLTCFRTPVLSLLVILLHDISFKAQSLHGAPFLSNPILKHSFILCTSGKSILACPSPHLCIPLLWTLSQLSLSEMIYYLLGQGCFRSNLCCFNCSGQKCFHLPGFLIPILS